MSSSFSTQQWAIFRSHYDRQWKVDFIWQLTMTSSVAGPRKSSKTLPKVKLAPKKSCGHCLMVCCWFDLLRLSESWHNHYIWEVGSTNLWDALKTAMPEAGTGQEKWSNSSPGLWSSASSAIFTCPLINWLWLLQTSQQHFTGKMFPQSVGWRKCFPGVCRITRHRFLCYRN